MNNVFIHPLAHGLILVAVCFSTCRAATEVFYQSPEFTVNAESVERDGKRAWVDPNTGIITSESHFRMNHGDRHVPAGRLTRPATWNPKHDLSGYPCFKSSYPLVDAVYRLSLDKVVEHLNYEPEGFLNASEGRPPWVRDTAYVVMMGCDALFPEASRKTLEWGVVRGKTIKPEQLSGTFEQLSDSIPSDSPCYRMGDFIIWIPAAWQYAKTTGDSAFIKKFYTEMEKSLDLAREVLFDPYDGLFDGGDTIGDGFSIYPENSTGQVMLKGTSVNLIHYKALLSMAEMAEWLERPEVEAADFRVRASALKAAVNRELWLPRQGFFSLLKQGREPAPVERSSLSGNSFALLWNATDEGRKNSILENLPDTPWGAPLTSPPWITRGGYHDQNIWPVIEGIWGTANGDAGHPDRMVKSLALLTANGAFQLNLSEMWSMFDGRFKGKEPQLWSCTAYLMELFQGLLGLHPLPQGVLVQPSVPEVFSEGFEISNYRYRDAVYTFKVTGFGNRIASLKVNGKPAFNLLSPEAKGSVTVEIEMAEELPFGFGMMPEFVGLEEGVHTAIPVDVEGSSASLKMRVISGPTATVSSVPVVDGNVDLDGFALRGGRPGIVKLCLVSAEGQMTRWRDLELRPALGLRWNPGIVEMIRPPEKGAKGYLDLIAENRTGTEKTCKVFLSPPAGLLVEPTALEVVVPAFGQKEIPISWRVADPLDYGLFEVGATILSGNLEAASILPVQVAESIDLRGIWVMKSLPKEKDGASFSVDDRDGKWKFTQLPMRWQRIPGFEDFKGTVWFRRFVVVPAAWEKHGATLDLGEISGKATVYVNETRMDLVSPENTHRFHVPAAVLRFGENNLIAVRINNSGPKSGLTGWPMALEVKSDDR